MPKISKRTKKKSVHPKKKIKFFLCVFIPGDINQKKKSKKMISIQF